MTEINARADVGDIHDLESVRAGDSLEVWVCGVLRYRGRAEKAVPHLEVVWLRETRTGERKMIAVDDYCLRSG